jgi:hypothetical protein
MPHLTVAAALTQFARMPAVLPPCQASCRWPTVRARKDIDARDECAAIVGCPPDIGEDVAGREDNDAAASRSPSETIRSKRIQLPDPSVILGQRSHRVLRVLSGNSRVSKSRSTSVWFRPGGGHSLMRPRRSGVLSMVRYAANGLDFADGGWRRVDLLHRYVNSCLAT